MKCINRKLYRLLSIFLTTTTLLAFAGCGKSNLPLDFKINNDISVSALESRTYGFADNLAVTATDVNGKTGFTTEDDCAAGLFDVNNAAVLYANGIHDRMNPASLTKIMTAICALKYGNLEDTILCSDNVTKLESGASTCGLSSGDRLTLEQALYCLMLPSANDAAVAIAEHISGSVDEFCNLMNVEAKKIGATNSNFVNPHGLTNEEHYTTVYDLYLITNEAIHYPKFLEIIQTPSYKSSMLDSSGNEKPIDIKSSNKYHDGTYSAPDSVTVIGGKTGTTSAAGSCLALVTRDSKNNPYISIILHASERSLVYEQMSKLLEEINKR